MELGVESVEGAEFGRGAAAGVELWRTCWNVLGEKKELMFWCLFLSERAKYRLDAMRDGFSLDDGDHVVERLRLRLTA